MTTTRQLYDGVDLIGAFLPLYFQLPLRDE